MSKSYCTTFRFKTRRWTVVHFQNGGCWRTKHFHSLWIMSSKLDNVSTHGRRRAFLKALALGLTSYHMINRLENNQGLLWLKTMWLKRSKNSLEWSKCLKVAFRLKNKWNDAQQRTCNFTAMTCQIFYQSVCGKQCEFVGVIPVIVTITLNTVRSYME